MKNIILIILLLSTILIESLSQTTLTSAINPSPGDIQYAVKVDTTGITPGNSGANQVWNFSSIQKIDSSESFWMLTSSTPYGSIFPTSNIANLDTCYDFFNETNSLVEIVGYFSHGTAIHYQDPETIMTYPFTYNSTFTDNLAVGFNASGDSVYETGTASAVGDAYGLINLPFGTFLNALRVKHTIVLNDSSITYQQVIHTTYTIYEWYVPNRKFSVFKIIYSLVSFLNYNFSYKNVYYNPASIPIGIKQISSNVPAKFNLSQNYPNPFNPSTKIKYQVPKTGVVKLGVFDIRGKEISELVNENQNPGTYEVEFDGSTLSSGVYFYKLQSGNFTETKRMILVK